MYIPSHTKFTVILSTGVTESCLVITEMYSSLQTGRSNILM